MGRESRSNPNAGGQFFLDRFGRPVREGDPILLQTAPMSLAQVMQIRANMDPRVQLPQGALIITVMMAPTGEMIAMPGQPMTGIVKMSPEGMTPSVDEGAEGAAPTEDVPAGLTPGASTIVGMDGKPLERSDGE